VTCSGSGSAPSISSRPALASQANGRADASREGGAPTG
jgi:hypothetical protein